MNIENKFAAHLQNSVNFVLSRVNEHKKIAQLKFDTSPYCISWLLKLYNYIHTCETQQL